MRTLFSTADVHPRDRFDYWHDFAATHVLDHDAKPECRREFHGELLSGALADIELFLAEVAPMAVWRTARQASMSADEFLLCRQVAGKVTLRQDDREVVLEPEDFTLLDPRLSYFARFWPGAQMLSLKVPRRSLEARIGKAHGMAARLITPSCFESRLASSLIGMLPTHSTEAGSTAGEIVSNQVLDLIALSLAKAMDGATPRMSYARSSIFLALTAAIEARLADPALDVEAVAAAAGVSRRYATAVFTEHGTSVRRSVLSRRLERCRMALEDPSQAHRTVSEIALGWGFYDMTHFARKFRQAYGASPREYRKTTQLM